MTINERIEKELSNINSRLTAIEESNKPGGRVAYEATCFEGIPLEAPVETKEDIFVDGYVKHIHSTGHATIGSTNGINGVKLTGDDLVAYIARVSNPSNQHNTATAPKLINYLIKHKHWSPFEMVNMCIEVKTSRGVAAQVLRHRSFSFQEFSQRYSKASQCIALELRAPDEKNRQSSTGVIVDYAKNERVRQHLIDTFDLYDEMVDEWGVAKECARGILPLNTATTLYMNGTLRSWIHYIQIREDATHVQAEHVEIALGAKDAICDEYPQVAKALGWTRSEARTTLKGVGEEFKYNSEEQEWVAVDDNTGNEVTYLSDGGPSIAMSNTYPKDSGMRGVSIGLQAGDIDARTKS